MRRFWIAGAAMLVAAPAVSQIEKSCEACHGAQGLSAQRLTPSLGGQQAFYVTAQLLLFREGQRASEAMAPVAKNLTDAELQALGEAFVGMPPPGRPSGKPDGRKYSRGRAIAERERCGSCHNPDFSGAQNVPRLANQREDYLRKALRDYKTGARAGYGNAVMPETVAGLKAGELADLAHYLAYFRP